MKLTPYWHDTASPFAGAAPGPVDGRFDVAVIGGGFTGLSAARAFARKGAKVVVLESGKVVGEASGRNGGHVNNGLSLDFSGVAGKLGIEKARELYRAFDAAVDTVERIVMEEQIACDFRRSGKIKLAAKPEHYEKIARAQAVLAREVDTDTAIIPRSEIRREVGSDAFHGGLLQTRSAMMHMGKFGGGIADAAKRHGAVIYENAAVTDVRNLNGRFEVITARGTVNAGQVLMATGATTRGWFFKRRIIPIGSFIIATEPLPQATLDAIMPTRRTATTTLNVGHYFRISPDDRLIFGGRARFALSSPRSDLKSGQVLEANMLATFPELKGTRIDYCWGGLIDLTADRLPRAGVHDGVHYALGFSGHGAQMSVHMGEIMADVMDGHAEKNPFRDIAWPAVPGHFGPPWFLPLVGAYYRLQDRLH